MVKKNIKNTIKKHNLINAGEHIVIGLSGGPDSVCLFSVLNELKDEMQITLHAVHVNHGFRPGAADEDQQYVEQLCEKCGVECTSFIYDCNAIAKENGLSSEEAGRKVRYESFLKVAEKLMREGSTAIDCDSEAHVTTDSNEPVPADRIKIAVAQNADDQAETVLFRLLRGTGTDGLAGMSYSRMEKNICVIRPLLDTWRKDIEAYCAAQGLEPRTDHTNLQPIYTRNKIRLDLIPYLQERFNPNVMEGLARLSAIASEDKEYLWQCAEEAYNRIRISENGSQNGGSVSLDTLDAGKQGLAEKPSSVTLDQQGLAELPAAIRHRVIMKSLQELGLIQDVTAAHLDAVDSILAAAGESKTVEFPDGYRVSVRYGEAAFYNVNRLSGSFPTADVSLQPGACGKNAHFSFSVCQMDKFSAKSHTQMPQTGETDAKSHTPALHGDQGADFDTIRQATTNQAATFDTIRQAPAPVPNHQAATFDADKVAALHGDAQPVLRTRRTGDYITIKGGRKKLQDLLVDMKVPKECRDSVKIIAVGSEVLWIPAQAEKGVKKARYSYRCKLDMDTKNTLLLEFNCEI